MSGQLEVIHDDMHEFVFMGGVHISFRDPFVFLLHSNVDRLFAMWQTDPAHPERLNPSTVYGSQSDLDVPVGEVTQNLNHNVEPWSTGHSYDSLGGEHFTRPWYAPESQGSPHNYKHPSVVIPRCYDTLSPFFTPVYAQGDPGAGIGGYDLQSPDDRAFAFDYWCVIRFRSLQNSLALSSAGDRARADIKPSLPSDVSGLTPQPNCHHSQPSQQ